MPSYHQKLSKPSMVFILGGEDEECYKDIDYSIVTISNEASINGNSTTDNSTTDKYNNKFRLFVNIFIFLKNILYFTF